VQELAELIELKLRANEHKQLEGVSSHYLYMKLMEEVQELFEANLIVHESNWYVPNEKTEALCRAVALEAADVAAVAGFFAARIKVLTDPGILDGRNKRGEQR
jgi:hypothetical protein